MPSAPFSPADAAFMQRALQLAGRGLFTTDPNPRVGCVLVRDGQIVGEGWHQWAGQDHAEVVALKAAGEAARGATAYVTLEPCCHQGRTPPCSVALIAAGVSRVVAAMDDPNPQVAGKGLTQLAQAGIDTASGLLAEDAQALNPGFCRRMLKGLPYVRSKLAMSLDGRTALANGESRWITGEAARCEVHRLRARSSAVLTGVGTVLADNPRLTARLAPDEPVQQPLRVILDTHLRTPPAAALLNDAGQTLILTTARHTLPDLPAGVRVERIAADAAGRPDLVAVIARLGEAGCNEIMVEAGSVLNGALLQAGLVDEWMVYLAPVILGDQARGLFSLPEITAMARRFALSLHDVERVGQDVRLTCRKTA